MKLQELVENSHPSARNCVVPSSKSRKQNGSLSQIGDGSAVGLVIAMLTLPVY